MLIHLSVDILKIFGDSVVLDYTNGQFSPVSPLSPLSPQFSSVTSLSSQQSSLGVLSLDEEGNEVFRQRGGEVDPSREPFADSHLESRQYTIRPPANLFDEVSTVDVLDHFLYIFEGLVQTLCQEFEPQDYVQFSLESRNLTEPVTIPFRRVDTLDVDRIFASVERVLTSSTQLDFVMYLQPSKNIRSPSPKILNFHGITDKDGKVFLDFKREMAFYDSDEIAIVDLYMDVSEVKNVHEDQYSISAQALSNMSVETRSLPAARVVTVENLATLVEGALLGIHFSYGKDGNLIMIGNVHYKYTLPIVLARCLGFLEASGKISELVRDLNKGNVMISSRSTNDDGIPNVVDVTFLLNGNGKLFLLHSQNRNIWNYVSKKLHSDAFFVL